MTHYIFQLLLFQILFLGVYELFLKKETFFSLNRIYLLLSPILAAIIPLLNFEILQAVVPTSAMVQLPVLFISDGVPEATLAKSEMEGLFPTLGFLKANAWLIGYFLGAVLSLSLFARKFLFLQKLKKRGKTERVATVNIVRIPKSRMACTFFNTIFLGEAWSKEEAKQILAHEQAHVAQKHSWDLLWFEALRIALWFNPFIYRQQAQLSILHEYIADEKVVQKFEKKSYFQDLLNASFGTRQLSFTNQFFTKSFTKKRIFMLQKSKSSRNAKLKYLLVLPLMFSMLTFVACADDLSRKETHEMAPPPPPVPPVPPVPEGVSKDFLELKEMMKAEGIQSDMTLEEYQMILKLDKKSNLSPGDDQAILYSKVDQVPVFPGCENLPDDKAKKDCMSKKIMEFVSSNFDTGLAKKLGLTGTQQINVIYEIDKTGKVVKVRAVAQQPELEDEAIRVVKMLPDMIPGKQKGKKVDVTYSLPIIFKIQ